MDVSELAWTPAVRQAFAWNSTPGDHHAMGRPYAPKTFLRYIRGSLLATCIKKYDVEISVGLEHLRPSEIDDLYRLICDLSPPLQRTIEGDFSAIASLAGPAGSLAMMREAERRRLDVNAAFLSAHNDHERAFWIYYHHHDIFDIASSFQEMDRVSAGRWSRRFVGRDLRIDHSHAKLRELAHLMRETYAKEGRGHFCHIDHYFRTNPDRHCFFAYPEDFASTDFTYSSDGALEPHTHKRAIEVIFVYRPTDGVLELMAPGGRERVDDLAANFTAAILNLPELPAQLIPNSYDLSMIKRADLTFPTDPDDGISQVLVREIQLYLPLLHNWRQKLVLSTDTRSAGRTDLHRALTDIAAANHQAIDDLKISLVKMTFVFASLDGKRGKRLTFEIGLPDRCTLKDEPYDQIVRKYLTRWGLAVDGDAPQVVARVGFEREPNIQLRRHRNVAGRIA